MNGNATMRRGINLSVLILAALLAAGCFEGKADVQLNPDGTGKITGEILFPLEPPWTGPPKRPAPAGAKDAPEAARSPEDEMRDAVTAIMKRSRGIDTWKDVAFQRLSDGRIHFRGTAYFKDFSKVKIHPATLTQFWFGEERPGSLTLILSRPKEKDDAKPPAKLSMEEMEKKLKDERTKYQKVRPTLGMALVRMKLTVDFRVPGSPAEMHGFEQARGALVWTVDGQKLLQAFDAAMADSGPLREMIRSGETLADGSFARMERALNKRMFGPKGEVWARTAGDLRVRFDYKAEFDEAKKAYPEMMVRLGLDKPRPPPAGKKPPAEDDGSKVPGIGLPEKLPDIPVPLLPGL